MASVERTAYPRFRPSLSRAEVEALYEPTDDELAFVRDHTRTDRGRLTLLVLLMGHQRVGRLPMTKRVPAHVRAYLAASLGLPADTPLGARTRQARHRYRQAIHCFLGVRSYSEGGSVIAGEAMRKAASVMSDPADLVNVAVEALVRGRAELPAFRALDRLAGRERERVHGEIYTLVAGRLTPEDRTRLDGLLKNDSVLQPDTVHADTHGQSEPVFGLAHLLGVRLMPRMRTWDDVAFYRPDAEASYRHLDALFTRTVDWGLIERHWADLMQVALSVRAGAVLPSMLLRRLGTQARKNTLYRAFRELGRVVRTLFLLDYVTDLPLRRSIRAATTKVESYNAFTERVRFGGETITTDDPVEQEKRVKYTDLVASAIMLQNVADLTDALAGLVGEGWAVTPGQVARLSPYGTARVKRFGVYVPDMDAAPPPLVPRPLGLAEEPTPL